MADPLAEQLRSLNEDQQQALRGLFAAVCDWMKFINAQASSTTDPISPSGSPTLKTTAAVIGARGMGKSTVLHRLRSVLKQQAEGSGLLLGEVVDAAAVRSDIGLLVSCILSLRAPRGDAMGLREAPPGDLELPETFREAVEAMLLQEQSHRTLAHDMAMSPVHYASLVVDGVLQRTLMADRVRRLLSELRPRRSFRAAVVFVDDLDLAAGDMVRFFVRELLNLYGSTPIFWVTAFDRTRLVRALSWAEIDSGRQELDHEVGHAQFAKFVRTECQFELLPWSYDARLSFRSFEEHTPGRAPLSELLSNAGLTSLLSVLPSNPRSLTGIATLISSEADKSLGPMAGQDIASSAGEPASGGPTDAKTTPSSGARADSAVSAEKMLRLVARTTGELELFDPLSRSRLRNIVRSYDWSKADELTDSKWAHLIAQCRTYEPIWQLPVPEGALRTTNSLPLEGFIESTIDIVLRESDVSPLLVLDRMPFVKSRLRRARIERTIQREDIGDWLPRATSPLQRVFRWQRWTSAGADWMLDLSPQNLWERMFSEQRGLPLALFQEFFVEPRIDSRRGPAEMPLPRSFRGILLVVAALAEGPWEMLERTWADHDPSQLTVYAAAITLSAYATSLLDTLDGAQAFAVERERLEGEGLYLPSERALQEALRISAPDLQIKYRELLDTLSALSATVKSSAVRSKSPVDVARVEIAETLERFLRYPDVGKLIPMSVGAPGASGG